jgi:hypothetical protein
MQSGHEFLFNCPTTVDVLPLFTPMRQAEFAKKVKIADNKTQNI